MNTYAKYCPNVFVAKCSEQHAKGDTIQVTTKYGKDNECIVHNCVGSKDGYFYYSITRADGFDFHAWIKRRSERNLSYAASADKKSSEYYTKSNKDRDFLSLCEPIKVGHHSERRHRKIIEQAHTNMGKSIEFSDKAGEYKDKAAYWATRANEINLSMPESLEYFEFRLEEAKEKHEGYKSGKLERAHSFSLTYAKKELNDITKKLETAKKLWS